VSTKHLIAEIIGAVESARENGTAAIYCDNVIQYLRTLENTPGVEPTQVEIENSKAELQKIIDVNKHNLDGDLEMFRSTIAAGQSAIKSSLLLNDGAAVAMLAFIGNLAHYNPAKIYDFAASLMIFASGALLIVLTSGATYLSQWLYYEPKTIKWGALFNYLCILLGLGSYGCFIWGLASSYFAFINF
jgi:hypothetical protein